MKKLGLLACALAAATAALPVAATADPPRRVSIIAVFNPITYGRATFVNGQLVGRDQALQPVELEQSAPPYTDWTPVAEQTADSGGYYSFQLVPDQTMQYRASSDGMVSKPVTVSVAPHVTLKATPVGLTSIRFNGTFAPSLDGQRVTIQRQWWTGAWHPIGSAGILGGKFAGRLRIHVRMTLRAAWAGDLTHLPGYSTPVVVTPRLRATSKQH